MLGQEHSITVDTSTPGRIISDTTVTRDHGSGLSPEDKVRYDRKIQQVSAQPMGTTIVAYIRTGQHPFYIWTNPADGKPWGKYYDERTRTLTQKPRPPEAGSVVGGLSKLASDTVGGIRNLACRLTGNPAAKLADKAAGYSTDPSAQGFSTAMSYAQQACGSRAGARVDLPKIAYYHKSQKLWHIYAPAPQGGGLGFVGPAGYVFLGTAATKPADAQDGGVIDDPIYKKWWFWAGLGGAAAATTGGVIWYKRRRRG